MDNKQEVHTFDLKLKISPSDNAFRKMLTVEQYSKLKIDTFSKYRNTCQGCWFKPLDEQRAQVALNIHVISINEEKPEESECNILCRACHSTQHIDVSIEKEWVKLINSTYSQKSLIEMCRVNAIHNSVKEDDTRVLKTPPLEFLEKMKAGLLPANTKAKVIFTSSFDWGDI